MHQDVGGVRDRQSSKVANGASAYVKLGHGQDDFELIYAYLWLETPTSSA